MKNSNSNNAFNRDAKTMKPKARKNARRSRVASARW